MFEQTFKNIDDILHKDAGCGSELDYVEQTSWVLFLKYLDDLERDRATAAEPPTSFSFERSGNEHATGVHDQLFSQVILDSPAAFHGGKVLEAESISITPHRPKINH